MIKNKWKLLVSSVITVLPIIAVFLWSGQFSPMVGNGWHFAWILPLILVTLHVLLHLLTDKEAERVAQNKKITNVSYALMPAISVYVTAMFIMIFLGMEHFLGTLLCLTFGTLFIVIGNYMPKAVRNRWFGIKISWTLGNDENWNATHRLTGRVSVIVGVIVLFGAFLPDEWGIALMLASTLAIVVIPLVYSYSIYKKHIANGTGEYDTSDMKYFGKRGGVATAVVAVVAVLVVILMLTGGSITYTVGDETIDVKGGGSSVSIDYDEIDKIEFRDEKVPGTRVMGYGSVNMLAGHFSNDEFGGYTRFTYSKSDANIVVYTANKVIVLSGEDTASTEALYNTLTEKIAIRGES